MLPINHLFSFLNHYYISITVIYLLSPRGGAVEIVVDEVAARERLDAHLVLGEEVVSDRGRVAGCLKDARGRRVLAVVEDGPAGERGPAGPAGKSAATTSTTAKKTTTKKKVETSA